MKVLNFSKNKKVEVAENLPLQARKVQSVPSEAVGDKMPSTKFVKLNNPAIKKKRAFPTRFVVTLFIFLTLIFTIGIFAYNYLYLPYTRIRDSVNSIQSSGSQLLTDFENKDLSDIDLRFAVIKSELTNINEEMSQYEFLSNFEYTKGYYQNFQVLRSLLDKSIKLMDSTLPDLKNLLKVTGFKTEKPVEGVIVVETEGTESPEDSAFSLVMKELPQYLALYKKVEPQIIEILNEVEKIDTDYVPQIGGTNYGELIQEVNDFAIKFPAISKQTTDFLEFIPQIIGSNEPARYLVVLQNETEMRASGGLLTAFGNLEMSNGEIGDIVLSDMWNLETYVSYDLGVDVGYRNIYGQLALMERGCGGFYLRAQDAGIYPDLKLTMQMLSDYYDVANRYNPENFPDYDYILIINNHFAETLISLLDPLEVEGFGTVTADRLYDLIKSETDSVENRGNPERKSIIKDIANAARKKLVEYKISDLHNIITAMINSIQAKDVGIYAPNDQELNEYLTSYGFTGETVKDFEGDYFQLSEAQNCALKINRWLRNDISQTININTDGSISKSVNVDWYQPEVYSDDYLDQYDMSGRFLYRAWVRLFMPNGASNIDSDGYENSGYLYYTPREYFDDKMEKRMSDNIIQFDSRRRSEQDPIPTAELNVTYNLPQELNYNENGSYKLLVQKHPGKSWGEKNTVVINHDGQTYRVEFVLDRDKVITYRDGIISVDNYDKSLDFILNLVTEVPWDRL